MVLSSSASNDGGGLPLSAATPTTADRTNERTGLINSSSNNQSSRRGDFRSAESRSILQRFSIMPCHDSAGDNHEEDEARRKRHEQQTELRRRKNSVFVVGDGPAGRSHNSERGRKKAQRHDQRGGKDAQTLSYKRDVEYDGENHLSVLFQLYGSVWPAVFPWCCAVLVETAAVWYLRERHIVDLTIASNTGHSFMSILVSFLIVTRTTITYNRFMEARQHLANLYRSSREIVHYTCILTNQNHNEAAQKWRSEVAYRTIVTLRVAVAALEYRSKGVNTWDVIPEEDHEKTELMVEHADSSLVEELHGNHSNRYSQNGGAGAGAGAGGGANSTRSESERSAGGGGGGGTEYRPSTDHFSVLRSLAHGPRTSMDENFRAPIVWTYNLRETILWPRKTNSTILQERPWHVNESMKLMALVSDFLAAYHELKKLVSTPFPFPLIQMTRTFLFFWIFTLPMVLAEDNDQPYEVFVLMFFITYGFLGLEYVNMELDDPYGNDPNDFPGQRWAETVFEDIYIAIYKTDGFDRAVALRSRISERTARGTPLQNYRAEVDRNQFLFSRGSNLDQSNHHQQQQQQKKNTNSNNPTNTTGLAAIGEGGGS